VEERFLCWVEERFLCWVEERFLCWAEERFLGWVVQYIIGLLEVGFKALGEVSIIGLVVLGFLRVVL
jgi:hypothetical protein